MFISSLMVRYLEKFMHLIYTLLYSDLATREDDDDDQDGLLAQAYMRIDLVRPSGSAEWDGTVAAKLNQVNDELFVSLK